jgi:signal transduction histidine kinase
MTSRLPDTPNSNGPQAHDWLTGGGEMGQLIRGFDWSQTSLGPIESWPQSLLSAVSILLPSKAQIAMFWGPDLITLYNDAYRPVLGDKHPGALGVAVREVWREIWETGLRSLFEGVLQTGEAFWASDWLFNLERYGFPEETFFDISYDPVRDESGKVAGLFCIVSESTGRVVSERRLRTLRDLSLVATAEAKSVEDACRTVAEILSRNPHDIPFALIYLLDKSGKSATLAGASGLQPGTHAAPRSVGISNDEVDSSCWSFDAVMQINRAIEFTDVIERCGELLTGVWPEPPHTAMVIPIGASGQDRAAGFLVAGVSPRRPLDDQHRAFFDLLATQISTTVANARAYEQERRRAESLAELDRAKTAFFSNVSHEFRTPLTLMLGPVADLLGELDGSVSAEQRERLDIAYRNGLRLQKLVNTLLDFSRIEAGRVQASYEATNLATLTSELASNFRSACERAGIDLVVDCPSLDEPIYVDPDMWEKIVLNLVSNAFKFTLSGSIEVKLRKSADQVELTVRDTGVGIPPEELPKVFERFHRVPISRGRTQEGSGIGLALVRELVKLHGGSVSVKSTLGEGTLFTVSLPRGKDHLPEDRINAARTLTSTSMGAAPFVSEALRWLPPAADRDPSLDAEQATPRENGDERRFHILLADDNADMRDYVSRLLSDRYEVLAVADGQAAWNAIEERVPDLVLSDVMMPVLDGFELLRRIRANPATQEVPVVLLSARAGEEARIEGLEATADDYIVKPFSARELLATVDAHKKTVDIRRQSREALGKQNKRLAVLWEAASVLLTTEDPDSMLTGLFEKIRDSLSLDVYTNLKVSETGDRLELVSTADQQSISRLGRDEVEFLETISHYVTLAHERLRLIEQLREQDRRKDEFLATLAHELRNPLAPIRNGLELIRQSNGDPVILEKATTIMHRQIEQMVRLVDDLLDVARISRNKLELRKAQVDLESVVRNAVETSRPVLAAAENDLRIELPAEPVFLEADPVRLAQVFSNLLNNAAKYSGPGGRVSLVATRTGDELIVRVSDTGIGIEPGKLSQIFGMFVQLDASEQQIQSGLGVGLTLVQRLIEMHGGSIEARSEGQGKGSEFIVRLPALNQAAQTSAEIEPAAEDRPTLRRRILVVDDNIDSAESMALMLQLSGHEVATAHDGLEGVKLAREFRPHVALLDLGMPKLDGYEAARSIRGQSWGQKMMLVALTGWGQEEDKQRSREAGFDAHLVKPIDFDVLEELVATSDDVSGG